MNDSLAKTLSKGEFDPEAFITLLSRKGEDELEITQKKVHTLAEETAVALKKNVYKNYSQFIETAKEISILESEMYQLSHMLTDQKTVMNEMLELSLAGDNVEGPEDQEETKEEDKQKNLAFLLEKVEGCSAVAEVLDRYLIYNGDLVEIDSESSTVIQKCHAFLLNDSVMIATWLPQRRGPVKYKFQTLYELDSLAVVNVKDSGPYKNAFKILMFPDTRMFQAESPKAKRQWLDILEETKKKKAALLNQRKEAAQERVSMIIMDSSNPFAEEEDTERPQSVVMETDLLHADWLQELPEDLDVCIAQRDFEGAVDLMDKVNEFLLGCPKSAAVREYRARIDHRIKQLTDVLIHELQVSPERSLRGGPRAARRAVTQLIRLGKSAQACDLFLKNRSAITKHNIRQLKIEGNTVLYVKRLCENFFGNLTETAKEFIKAFPEHFGCFSAFVVWAKDELKTFMAVFDQQVFSKKATLTTVAECVYFARQNCNKLAETGIEMTFLLDSLFMSSVEKTIVEGIDIQLDAINHRASEDRWRPFNLDNGRRCRKFEEEFVDMGIVDIHNYTYDECWTGLTSNTIHFTKAFSNFTNDVLKLHCQDLHQTITDGLRDIFKAQIQHVEKSSQNPELKRESKAIVQNATFLVESFIPIILERYAETTNQALKDLYNMNTVVKKIKKESKATLGEFV